MDQRRFVKELFQPDVPLDIVSMPKKTVADKEKDRKRPSMEKDLEDFNFKKLSHGKTESDS